MFWASGKRGKAQPAVTRDAEDLATLLRAYEDSPPSTEEFLRAASLHGYAYDRASARYLGARLRSELGDEVADAVLDRISSRQCLEWETVAD